MSDDIMSLVIRMIFGTMKFVWKLAKPVLGFTGLWAPLLVSIISAMLQIDNIPVWLWVIAWVITAYTLLQNLIRLFKRDKSMKLYKLLIGSHQSRQERRFTNPKANSSLSFSEPCGVVFGRLKGKWICKPENVDGHILVVGGPGSGKTASVGIESLFCWGKNSNAPVFAIDIKGELHKKTKHRRPNSKVFSLSLPDGYGYNPFYLIDDSRNVVEQIKAISTALLPIPPEEKSPFWKQNGQAFITGAMLWAYKKEIPFAEICEMIQAIPPRKLATAICEDEFKEPKLFMGMFCDLAEQTLTGIYAEISAAILPFATDEQLRSALSKSRSQCISPSDLDNGTSIYIHLEEHRLEQLKGLLTLLVNQFLKHFEQRSEENSNRVLFLLDELPRLGRIPAILDGMATLRSKGITVCCIIQSLAQLDMIYGQPQRRVIVDNASYIAILRVTDVETAKNFADMVGTYDKTKKSYSDNQPDMKVLGSSGTSTTTEEKRIIKPEELNRLDDELVLITPFGFNRIQKVYYFRDKYFQKLLSE